MVLLYRSAIYGRLRSIFFATRLHFCTFLIGSVPNPVEHTVTIMLLSFHHTNFTSSLRSVLLPTAVQISPRLLLFFIFLIGTNRHFLSLAWSFLPNRFLHPNCATSTISVGVACFRGVAKDGDTRGRDFVVLLFMM